MNDAPGEDWLRTRYMGEYVVVVSFGIFITYDVDGDVVNIPAGASKLLYDDDSPMLAVVPVVIVPEKDLKIIC